MTDYLALKSAWNAGAPPQGATGDSFATGDSLSDKLAKVNGWTVAGPDTDVPVGEVAGYCELTLWQAADPTKLWITDNLIALAAGAASETQAVAAKALRVFGNSKITTFQTSVPAKKNDLSQMLDVLVAAGMDSSAKDDVLAMAATRTPWWRSAGYSHSINGNDLVAAGLN